MRLRSILLAALMALVGLSPALSQQQYDAGGRAKVSVGAVAVPGTQRALSIATATALTIPATATSALIQAQGTNNASGVCLYWQDDGTSPTASAGQQLAAGGSIYYRIQTLPIKLIAATGATCAATISYYQ